MKINVIPYEDRKNNFYLIGCNKKDGSQIEIEIIARACNELNFAEMKELIKILENNNFIENFKSGKVVLQLPHIHFQFSV